MKRKQSPVSSRERQSRNPFPNGCCIPNAKHVKRNTPSEPPTSFSALVQTMQRTAVGTDRPRVLHFYKRDAPNNTGQKQKLPCVCARTSGDSLEPPDDTVADALKIK